MGRVYKLSEYMNGGGGGISNSISSPTQYPILPKVFSSVMALVIKQYQHINLIGLEKI
jgi:hypothetical protein